MNKGNTFIKIGIILVIAGISLKMLTLIMYKNENKVDFTQPQITKVHNIEIHANLYKENK